MTNRSLPGYILQANNVNSSFLWSDYENELLSKPQRQLNPIKECARPHSNSGPGESP